VFTHGHVNKVVDLVLADDRTGRNHLRISSGSLADLTNVIPKERRHFRERQLARPLLRRLSSPDMDIT
jgi:hypothetical protein